MSNNASPSRGVRGSFLELGNLSSRRCGRCEVGMETLVDQTTEAAS